ncbi:MAG TPA: fasciclin domain-containing protein [Anaerolineae bacterium]|nr:fasciclin domain-containing protein [Anaerolineae bacterium]
MKKSIFVPVLLSLTIIMAACAPAVAPAPTQAPAPTKAAATEAPKASEAPAMKDIVDTAVAAGSFKTLATALQAAGLVDALKGKGPFTVFAPTDEAFAKLPAGTLEALLKDPKALAEVLKYHVVSGAVKAADVVKLSEAKSLQGEPIAIKVDGGKVMVNGANVVSTDIEASNGIIHVIDAVILPPSMAKAEDKMPAMDIVDTAVAAGNFKTLAAALKAAGLIDTLKGAGPFTVFAPTDEAFAKLPAGTVDALLKDPKALGDILKYHVVAGKVMASDVVKLSSADTLLGKPVTITVNGDKVMIGNANVVKTDIETSNGVIHVIDTVLLPPAADAMSEAPTKDIVDTAVAAGNFKTLAAALKAAGLIDALKGAGPFTVFAPTDDAFAALPKGTLEALLKDPKKLGDILKYHVVAGKVLAADAAKLTEAKTLEGAPIKISVKDGKVFINDAQVTTADILTTNGVIHVINKVILPPQ